jgi:hypothetical protein
MRQVADDSVNKVLGLAQDPEHASTIKRSAFEAALDGIRSGKMTYAGDAMLPMI